MFARYERVWFLLPPTYGHFLLRYYGITVLRYYGTLFLHMLTQTFYSNISNRLSYSIVVKAASTKSGGSEFESHI